MTAGFTWRAFDELPVLRTAGVQSSWDVFGVGDSLGTLNFITPEVRAAALTSAVTGEVINVSLPLTEPSPPLYGRQAYEHYLLAMPPDGNDDYIDNFYLQASTQWDGLRHVRCADDGYYGGYTGAFSLTDPATLGIHHWAQAGIIGRGVLIDVPRHHDRHGLAYAADAGTAISAGVLRAAAADCGVEFRSGDILCLNFGWTDSFYALAPADRGQAGLRQQFSGLSAAEDTAKFIWDHQIAAAAADNPALEASPGEPQRRASLHRRLIPGLGCAVGELFDFRALARACAARNRWDFLFAAVPLNLPGGVGSPGNAVAIL
jgi:Putative cyclase